MVVYRKDPSKVENSTGSPAISTENLNGSDEADKTLAPACALTGSPGGTTWKPGVPRAVLTCRPNSHPFPERVLGLDQPAKVGRSVARSRQAPNNAIFDCKVLSRNHALLWYDNGKFYLQDTKSSNGTFVNNQRLSKGSEESPAREVCSGDIVQFGVDVVENSRKVTHGCIVATLRLFLPDGKEAKASPSTAVAVAPSGACFTTQDMYQLSQCIQEAIHREQILQNKMATLQRVVSSVQEAAENNWKAMIEEDRLLHRIETLESQLQACSKTTTDEKLREEIARLQEEKDRYQNTAKESLQKVLQEKLEAVRKVQDLEYNVSSTEEECTRLREVYETAQKEISLLASRNDQHQRELTDLQKELKDVEENCRIATEEKVALEKQIEELKCSEQVLAAKIESLRADNDFSKEQLAAMKARFEQLKKAQYIEDGLESPEIKESLPNNQESSDALENSLSPKENANKMLQITLDAEIDNLEKEELKETMLSKELQAKVCELEEELEQLEKDDVDSAKEPSLIESTDGQEKDATSEKVQQLQAEINNLKELLAESREKKNAAYLEIAKLKEQLEKARVAVSEGDTLEEELAQVRMQAKDQEDEIRKLREELSQLEETLQAVREELCTRQFQLCEEEHRSQLKQEELKSLQSLLEEEERGHERTDATCEALKKQLHEAQNSAKQHQNESEHLRRKVRSLTEELRNRANVEKSEGNHSEAEYDAVSTECATMKARIRTLEDDMQRYKNENAKLLSDYGHLQEAYAALECATASHSLESGDTHWIKQLEVLRQKADSTSRQLRETIEELAILKEKYAICSQEKADLQQELRTVADDFKTVTCQTKTISACSIVPLCILLLAVLLGFYPSLSYFTGTAEKP